jgi:uncharacterized protein
VSDALRVVEQMLGHAFHGRWDALRDLLADDFVIAEPPSLPYGGEHHGVDGYIALMQRIGARFALRFDPPRLYALDDETVLVRMHVHFDQVRMPVLELMTVRDARVTRSEVFLFDAAALA